MVETAHFALILALVISLVQSVLPVVGARRGDAAMMATATPSALAVFALVAYSFAGLTSAYLASDFSVLNVVQNSHSLQPFLYRLTGVWGNHEGSMLLWILILAFFGALVALFGDNLPASLKALVIGVQGWIGSAFLLFIIVTSNPFERVIPAPLEGAELNPILQDIGLAIHPPLLYLGYVGFSISFAFAVAALIDGRIDSAWARWVRPWTLAAWVFLTLGIAIGSYWAYYELGWGGWWFWDPVENASFLPWLSGTALLHSAIVMEKRAALKVWTILLAIITFSLSLLGTFLVRSGVLTSVHSFATDPDRGLFILMILITFIGGSLALFALRAPMLRQGGVFSPLSREGSLVLNNLFLSTATATVLIGTLYPLALEAVTGDKISVGEPFFNLTFVPLMIPLLVAVPFGALLSWKRADLYAVCQRLFAAFAIALLAVGAVYIFVDRASLFAALGIGLAAWLMMGALTDLATKSKLGQTSFSTSMSRLSGLPSSVWGTAMAHFGLGVTVAGIVAVSTLSSESVLNMEPGQTTTINGYSVTFDGYGPYRGSNFVGDLGRFTIAYPSGRPAGTMTSSKRIYPASNTPTTEAGIRTFSASQLYVSLGDVSEDGSAVVRLWWKSQVTLIWLGAIVMAFGGVLSLADRRLRVGAPRPAPSRSTAPAPTPGAGKGAAA